MVSAGLLPANLVVRAVLALYNQTSGSASHHVSLRDPTRGHHHCVAAKCGCGRIG